MDLFVAARAADVARIHIATVGRAGSVAFHIATGTWTGHAKRETHELGARYIHASAGWQTDPQTQHDPNPVGNAETHGDTNAGVNANANACSYANTDSNSNTDSNGNTDSNSDTGSNTNTDARAADVQPCVRDRDGERGVDQPDR